MDKHQECLRCNESNGAQNNFCWQCGLELTSPETNSSDRRGAEIASGIASGIAAVLAGALGGVVVGILIVVVTILSLLNAVAEMFQGCAASLLLLSVLCTTVLYSLANLFF